MLASAAGATASFARLTVLLGHGGDSGGVGEEQRGRSGRERDGRRSARRRTCHGDRGQGREGGRLTGRRKEMGSPSGIDERVGVGTRGWVKTG
jgi:hypothetical protein